MNTEKQLKGTIKNGMFILRHDGVAWIEGNVYGHSDFRDGQYIHTSKLVSVNGQEVETLNSKYRVEWNPTFPVCM